MLNQYMVEIELPGVMTQKFMSLIPAQRARVNELMMAGDLRSYTLALDRSRLWVVVNARSEATVQTVLDSFPIMPYCEARVHELLFHDMATHELPRMSLN